MLRGIGETPIMPLGVSYLDDFSREENTPFYLGKLLLHLSRHCPSIIALLILCVPLALILDNS